MEISRAAASIAAAACLVAGAGSAYLVTRPASRAEAPAPATVEPSVSPDPAPAVEQSEAVVSEEPAPAAAPQPAPVQERQTSRGARRDPAGRPAATPARGSAAR